MNPLGVCLSPVEASMAAKAGFDFFEVNVQSALVPDQDDETFADIKELMRAAEIPILAANCFLPAHLTPCGPAVERSSLEHWTRVACQRASEVGIKTIVFGSGAARKVPAGFDRQQAWEQLVSFSRMAAGIAASEGVTLVLEPLNQAECNILNSVAEGTQFVREVDHAGLRLLVDAYHWSRENEPAGDIVAAGELITHVHLATCEKRLFPGAEDFDFTPFLGALKEIAYTGPLSIEAKTQDLATDGPRALEVMQAGMA